jgi:Replication protein C C-terminal region
MLAAARPGVPESLWAAACLAMGRELVEVAVAIVSTKEPEHFTGTPGGYFHSIVAKAKAGQLHLDPHGLGAVAALDPKHHHERGRGGAAHRCDSDRAW